MSGKPAAGYIRVSTEEQSQGWSMTGQEEQINKYAVNHGYKIVHVYQDESSGSGEERPGLDHLIADAHAGAFVAIIIVHTSRLFRNVALARRYKELLRDKIGIQVISINQPILDPNDPAAFLMEGINELFDEYYIHQLRFWTRLGKQTRAKKGLWNGTIPFGYERGQNGVPIPHPINAEGVQLAFKAYSTGRYSDRKIAELLNEKGYTTTGNWGRRPFTKDTVNPMLKNEFYLGLTKYKDQTYPGKHKPLIARKLFITCEDVRASRRGKPRALGQKKRIYVLSGIARCHLCGTTLRCQATQSGKKWRYYRHAAEDRGLECPVPGRLIRANILEDQWSEVIGGIILPKDWRNRIEELIGNQDERSRILKERATNEEKLRRLTRLYSDMMINDKEYQTNRYRLQQRLSILVLPNQTRITDAANYLVHLHHLWNAATLLEQREITRTMLDGIVVDVQSATLQFLEPKGAFKVIFNDVCQGINITVR